MFSFFKKKVVLPDDFYYFPVYTHGKVKKGPIKTKTKDYKRLTYYVDSINGFDTYLTQNGFQKKSDVKYQYNSDYIIIEPIQNYYKIAYHKKTNLYQSPQQF